MELEVASEAAGEAWGTAERAQERVGAARVRVVEVVEVVEGAKAVDSVREEVERMAKEVA